MSRCARLFFAATIGFLVPQRHAPAQGAEARAPKPSMLLVVRETSDASLAPVADALMDTLELILRLAGRHAVQRADFLGPYADLARASLYFREKGFDGALFGSIAARDGGGYRITLKGWRGASGSVEVEEAAEAQSALDIFDIGDRLGMDVLEKFTGQRIGLGLARFVPSGGDLAYRVYVDGLLLGENVAEARIPAGERDIAVVLVRNGVEVPAVRQAATLEEGQSLAIEFDSSLKVAQEPQVQLVRVPPEAKPPGALVVGTVPAGATIRLDDAVVGLSPIALESVSSGLHEVAWEKAGFLGASRAVTVSPGETANLDLTLTLDPDSPSVKGALRNETLAIVVPAAVTAVQAVWFLSGLRWETSDPSGLLWTRWTIAIIPRVGLLYAGEPLWGTVANAAFLASEATMLAGLAGGLQPVMYTGFGCMVASALADMVLAGVAVQARNRRAMEAMRTAGVPQTTEESRGVSVYTLAFFGGGSFCQVGLGFGVLRSMVNVELAAGLSRVAESSTGIDSLAVSLAPRLRLDPLAPTLPHFRPYAAIGAKTHLGVKDYGAEHFGFAFLASAALGFRLESRAWYFMIEEQTDLYLTGAVDSEICFGVGYKL